VIIVELLTMTGSILRLIVKFPDDLGYIMASSKPDQTVEKLRVGVLKKTQSRGLLPPDITDSWCSVVEHGHVQRLKDEDTLLSIVKRVTAHKVSIKGSKLSYPTILFEFRRRGKSIVRLTPPTNAVNPPNGRDKKHVRQLSTVLEHDDEDCEFSEVSMNLREDVDTQSPSHDDGQVQEDDNDVESDAPSHKQEQEAERQFEECSKSQSERTHAAYVEVNEDFVIVESVYESVQPFDNGKANRTSKKLRIESLFPSLLSTLSRVQLTKDKVSNADRSYLDTRRALVWSLVGEFIRLHNTSSSKQMLHSRIKDSLEALDKDIQRMALRDMNE
jgi:hypothetical protein